MMSIKLRTALLGTAVAVPLLLAGVTAPVKAGEAGHRPVRYVITELDTLGGADSYGASINNHGWVAGYSRLPTGPMRATLWRGGSLTDLGTLGPPDSNSAVLWPVKNTGGLVVGVTETAEIDPHRERWSCWAFFEVDTPYACRGFVWERGVLRALPTFGGTHGFAAGANNLGQVVGWAEVAAVDPTCNQKTQFLGFLPAVWDTRNGDRIRRLPLLAGDSAGSVTVVNDRNQMAGISGTCSNAVGGASARAAVFWENGRATDMGNLGAAAWVTPMGINQWGMVVGFTNQAGTPDEEFNEIAFFWMKGRGMRSLGVLDGNLKSQALGINNLGHVVGLSRGGTAGLRAFVWRNGTMTDLNTLAPDYAGHLQIANDINDDGTITGRAVTAAGTLVAFVATPVRPAR